MFSGVYGPLARTQLPLLSGENHQHVSEHQMRQKKGVAGSLQRAFKNESNDHLPEANRREIHPVHYFQKAVM